MTKVHKNRLRKLADHLLTGKRYHRKFNFSVFTTVDDQQRRCGSAGCALGECQTVFPRAWHWPWAGEPAIKGHAFDALESAEDFFGLDTDDALALFYSCNESPLVKPLPATATRTQVARRILKFVEAQ